MLSYNAIDEEYTKSEIEPTNNEMFADKDSVKKAFNDGTYGDDLYFLTYGGFGDPENSVDNLIIYSKNNKIYIVYYEINGRYIIRELSKEEFEGLNTFVHDNKIDSLTGWSTPGVCDGTYYEYMHCTKNKTVSFDIGNPEMVKNIYDKLVKQFTILLDTGKFTTHYTGNLANAKILIKRENYHVQSVWKNGNDFRALIRNQYGILTWNKFSNNSIGEKVDEPAGFTAVDASKDIPQSNFREGGYNNYPWQITWNSYYVRVLDQLDPDYYEGLWLTKKGEEPKLIVEGKYANPIVIPNTDWVVCKKLNDDWTKPNNPDKIVKIDLKTFKETNLNIEPSKNIKAIAYVNNNLLIERDSDKYLYDIKTDTKKEIDGEFAGLDDMKERFLQKSSTSDEYYAVKDGHILGKINIKTFKFTPLAEYDNITITSMNVWVEEDSKKVYIAVNGDLLELPLNIK